MAIVDGEESHHEEATRLLEEGWNALRRFWQTGTALDLTIASTCSEQLTHLSNLSSENLTAAYYLRGISLVELYGRTGARAEVDAAIACFRSAIDLASPADTSYSAYLGGLANALSERCARYPNYADLEEAISVQQRATELTSANSPNYHITLHNLGNRYHDRYKHGHNEHDLEKAIENWYAALALIQPGAPGADAVAGATASGLFDRYQLHGRKEDLDAAITLQSEAVKLESEHSAQLAESLARLTWWFAERYRRYGDLEDWDRRQEIVEHLSSLDSSLLSPAALLNLGNRLLENYSKSYRPERLEEALATHQRAYLAASDRHLPLASYENALAATLLTEYEITGDEAHLARAHDFSVLAASRQEEPKPRQADYLNTLGAIDKARYRRSGELRELEEAIDAWRRAASAAPDAAQRSSYLQNVGNGWDERYSRTLDFHDLHEAVSAFEQALATTDQGSQDLPGVLLNLGAERLLRYRAVSDLTDLESALSCCEKAVNILENREENRPDMVALPRALTNLGVILGERATRFASIADAQEAVRIHERALNLTPHASPDMPMRFTNLAVSLRHLGIMQGSTANLDRAIYLARRAVRETPAGSPSCPQRLSNLADALIDRYRLNNSSADLNRAIEVLERAREKLRSIFTRISVSYKIGQQRQSQGIYHKLAVAYVERAGYGAPETTDDNLRAVQVIEESKSRLLAESVSRQGLSAPAKLSGPLVDRERTLLGRLTEVDSADLMATGTDARAASYAGILGSLVSASEREALVKELEDVWATISSSGSAGAAYVELRRGGSARASDLRGLAEELGPNVAQASLLVTSERTLLFVLRAGFPIAVTSRDTTQLNWEDILRRLTREVHEFDRTGRRRETWHAPLRAMLSDSGVAPLLEGIEQLILSPSGPGHLVPWAAVLSSGLPGSSGAPGPHLLVLPALDLGLLLARRDQSIAQNVFVAGDPMGDLPYSAAEAREVAKILGVHPFVGAELSSSLLVTELPKAKIAHVATHAVFERHNPLASKLQTTDGFVSAADLLSQELDLELLVLSACDTGRGQSLGGEELVGLPYSCLSAGCRSIVVSLWPIDDSVTSILMTSFHRERMNGVDIAGALHRAMQEVRSHPGCDHTYYWAGFQLVGPPVTVEG